MAKTVDREIDVKAIRTRLGLTHAQFAEQIGASVQSVQRWEGRRGFPATLTAQRIRKLENGTLSNVQSLRLYVEVRITADSAVLDLLKKLTSGSRA